MSDGNFEKYLAHSGYKKYTSNTMMWIEIYKKAYKSKVVILCVKKTSH